MGIELVLDSGVGEIVLNRPEKMNALNDAMAHELSRRLDEAEAARVRALLIRGEGPAFSAGRDIGGADPTAEDAQAILENVFNRLVRRIADFPAPTFAAVHGACLGAGLGVALACDVVYAAEDAKIGSPFARIGAVLDSGGHSFFVARMGAHRALELIYTGQLISGRDADTWGLVNRSVPRGELLQRVREIAASVAKGPTAAFLQSKRLVRRIEDEGLGLSAVLEAEAKAQGEASKSEDYREGFAAFQQKRVPRFAGR